MTATFLRSKTACAGTLLLLAAAFNLTISMPAHAKVLASKGQIELPTYPWAAVKHPYFRGTDRVNIYPYPMLDFLSREKTNRTYRTVVLENEYLRITFLPELGGKIHEVIDKTTGQPMFYVNHVIKPGLIGQCGAWTSGGVEWNTGPQGHTVGCMQPVAVEILPPEKDGSRSVAIGETERIYGTKWTVVVTLRPGRSFIEERIRIYNPTETIRPYYFWNCTAVPNTPGFRFIYPMTLGTDHGSEKFFNWPIHEGRDLTRGTNYQDASSIFAWHCDQGFFGSYDGGADRGVVSYANHHQVPGKKAWTWGQGGFGKMHQMDLTDTDGPYNEVQTGPLLTQGEVGRLDPCEAVEWKEWWYPVHALGGFTFANKNVAANAEVVDGKLRLRIIGTGTWPRVRVGIGRGHAPIAERVCRLDPQKPAELEATLSGSTPVVIGVGAAGETLAEWLVPLDLPTRRPPEKKQAPETASEFVKAGWQEFLFARFPEAEARFRTAIEKDAKCRDALVGLAHLYLDREPAKAVREARAAVAIDPECGPAHYLLAVATTRLNREKGGRGEEVTTQDETALAEAWKATLDPATATAGRALVARLLMLEREPDGAVAALSDPGPWQNDPVCRNRLALALHERGDHRRAEAIARQNLAVDPLDCFAQSISWLALPEHTRQQGTILSDKPVNELLELVAQYSALGRRATALMVLEDLYVHRASRNRSAIPTRNGLADYWFLDLSVPRPFGAEALDKAFAGTPPSRSARANGWPHDYETLTLLKRATETDQADGEAALYLGHLLFHLGRHAEGRAMWKKAAELGAEPVIAYRALGMAAKTLDHDSKSARDWLEKANHADPKDSIVARDLANVLFSLADKAESDAEKRALATDARDRLKAAFAEGKGRSDFVALLARAQNRLDEFAATARMLDSVRVTIWEGAHEVHDLFVQSHLALGEGHLKAGRAAEALAEFSRALEYPTNLATGKLENAREAHIHYLRGNALAALGRKQEAVAAWKLAANEPESTEARLAEARKRAKEALDKLTRE